MKPGILWLLFEGREEFRRLTTENARLREMLNTSQDRRMSLLNENAALTQENNFLQMDIKNLAWKIDEYEKYLPELEAENVTLREELELGALGDAGEIEPEPEKLIPKSEEVPANVPAGVQMTDAEKEIRGKILAAAANMNGSFLRLYTPRILDPWNLQR